MKFAKFEFLSVSISVKSQDNVIFDVERNPLKIQGGKKQVSHYR